MVGGDVRPIGHPPSSLSLDPLGRMRARGSAIRSAGWSLGTSAGRSSASSPVRATAILAGTGPDRTASAANGGSLRALRTASSEAASRPGSASRAASITGWLGRSGLHEHLARTLAAADQARGPCEQGQGLLAGPEAGSQQLLVEVQERHRPHSPALAKLSLPVQDSLCANEYRRRRERASAGRHLPDWAAGEGLELFSCPADPDSQQPQHT